MITNWNGLGRGADCPGSNPHRWNFLFWFVWVHSFVLLARAEQAGSGREITTFREFYALGTNDLTSNRVVRFQGVVLCSDVGWGQLYVYDGAQTTYLNPRQFRSPLATGDQVEIIGFATIAGNEISLTNLEAVVQGRSALPRAHSLPIAQLDNSFGQWVETTGRVRIAETSRGRLALVIQEKGVSCLVYVLGAPKPENVQRLVDAQIRVSGINASKIAQGKLEAASVFVPGIEEVTIVEAAPMDRSRLPVIAIETLLHQELGPWTNRPVHINGAITSYRPGESAVISDPTGELRLQVIQMTNAQLGQHVDAWGFLCVTPQFTVLKDSYFEAISQPKETAATPISLGSSGINISSGVVLTNISDVLKLPRQDVSWNRLVQLSGVITYADPEWHVGFFQDHDHGIFLDLRQPEVHAGQWVEVRAKTHPGGFAPQLQDVTVKRLGMTNLPPPARVTLDDLADGHLDAHWIQMDGVVRRVSKSAGRVNLMLMTPRGSFHAVLTDFSENPAPNQLVDALVRIQGACGSQFNARGQLTGITVHVPGWDSVATLEAAPADPFDLPPTPIAEVARFDPNRLSGRRIRVRGVVTFSFAENGFILQDEAAGIRVYNQHAGDVHVGDSLDVLGFPAVRDFSPGLEEAVYRRTQPIALPLPQLTTAEGILLHGTKDATVVRLEARLLQTVARSAHPKLVLQNGSIIFTAHLVGVNDGDSLYSLQSGSLLRVTGVCSIQMGENHQPESLRLQLASSHNVTLVEAPSWWTARQMLALLGGMGIVAALAAGWVMTLQRQVKQRTQKLQEEIDERKRAEAALKRLQSELIATSRLAGMAEVATTVLHNVGNVLNSVNVSATLVADTVRKSRMSDIARIAALMNEHAADLGEFLACDSRGRQVPVFLDQLGKHLTEEKKSLLGEIESLRHNIEHINDIVAMQQNYARVSGVSERVEVAELVEDALRMNAEALTRHGVEVVRDYEPGLPLITIDKHKTLQILVNLIRNAKHACKDSSAKIKQIRLRIQKNGEYARISVVDNGVGVPPENLTRIFNHGFTTKKGGHGFGLHSGALAAREMHGSLCVESAGPGQGANFILDLPYCYQAT